jgi:hypothetical protein
MAFGENIILHDPSSKVMKNILKSSGYLTLSNGIFPNFYQGPKAKGFWAIWQHYGQCNSHFSIQTMR